ncbi:hypothetical protein HKX48_004068 [Thoreauomyces humboldtii]|nr:hypothetical protein HKX48_004068 [Thoreauomyces humboldtii]
MSEYAALVKYYALETLLFIKKWYLSLPLASATVVMVTLLASIIDALRGFSDFTDLGVCPPYMFKHFLSDFYHLVTATLFHQTIASLLLNLLFFPPLNKMLETQRGTLHSLNFVICVSLVANIIYSIIIMPVYAIFGGVRCIGGLGAVMYALAAVEANEKAGVFKTRRIFGVPLPGAIYPWLVLVLSWAIFGSPFFYNLAGILAGLLYHLGVLKFLLLPERALLYLESVPPVRYFADWNSFIRVEASVSLPSDAGDLDDGSSQESSGLLGKITSIFSKSRGYSRI